MEIEKFKIGKANLMNVLVFGGFDRENRRLYVMSEYVEVLLILNAKPIIFPISALSTKFLKEYIQMCECVLFCGGEDVHPKFYGKEPQVGIRKINLLRDEIELEAIKISYEMDRRVLAICRGLQVMNVAFGGTLIQDLERKTTISHYQNLDGIYGYHTVEIVGGLLASIFGSRRILVNSFHHQAIEEVAPGFEIEAVSADGIVEAISKKDRSFFVGVQWHPELMVKNNLYQKELFERFLEG
ncbi:gamma-glutamyl-gamma-aminobutyrate hydrolase family protein [Anaerocellum diazotrophicum]|uniref:Gamma-glutamyl-gamma-aminobutyrate hydrolase n=1 Tax=Caldicellulosiruptor diazotrophicus TaxID=2806205 RepID=A0ABN6EAR6_9FIRM|nr:gamma-glutamyl-gamma-aminobutyrate hydrolase family protein [Caldicellulosiruptor diazotrophicus]BCS81918.1 gamma-glutamyl-gamma-aminobutyrate hydrolase [Caldicellulosiruptor diazotrophicus]